MLSSTAWTLVLAVSCAFAKPYSCGPFLLQPAPESMTIVIDHVVPVAARLAYGVTGQGMTEVVAHPEAERHHVFALSGLQPDTEYAYEITTAASGLSSGPRTFRTLPVAPDHYRVVALGDVRTLPLVWHRVSQRVLEREKSALFMIGTGDYPTDGRRYEQWISEFFVPARALLARMPMWPAIGNHEMTRRSDDLTREEASQYFSLFELPGNERWYRVDYHLMTLLILDSNSRMRPGTPQYDWCRQQLRSERNRFTLVAFHHAPLTSGPHGKLLADGTPAEWPIDEGRRYLVPLFEMYGVDLVLNGHDHLYERSEKAGIVYVVTGGGGAPLYAVNSVANPFQKVALSTNHYVALDITAERIELTSHDVAGTEIDRCSIPASQASLARRRHFITQRMRSGVVFGSHDAQAFSLPLELRNTLDHPLRVSLSLGNVPPSTYELEPGASRKESLTLKHLRWPAPSAPPWRAGVKTRARISLAGQHQALPVVTQIDEPLILERPTYPAPSLEGVTVDGDLGEWNEIPPIVVDETMPIVRGAETYGGTKDMRATVRFAWWEDRLLLAVEVSDDELLDDGMTKPAVNDSFTLFFATGADPGARPAPRVAMYSFTCADRTDPAVPPGAPRHIEHALQRHEGGYRLEISIPRGRVGLAPPKARVGLDLVLVDRDAAGTSFHRLWSSHLRVNDSSEFGFLVLQ